MIIASQIEPISPYVFSAGKPVLITVDPISSAILKIELAEKRRAAEPPGGGRRPSSPLWMSRFVQNRKYFSSARYPEGVK
jgi:hypothetical protein